MPLDLATLKQHCNVTDAADDLMFNGLLIAAAAQTAADLGFAVDDSVEFPGGTPADVEHAILMLAAHWYENRETTLVGVTAQSVPFGYEDIVRNHRSYTYG